MADQSGFSYEDISGTAAPAVVPPPPSTTASAPSSLSYENAISTPPNKTWKQWAQGFGEASGYGMVNAIPGGQQLGAAAETYLPTWLSGAPSNASSNYAENLSRIRANQERLSHDYPVTSALAPIGTALATLPVAGPAEAASAGIARLAPSFAGDAARALGSGAVGAGYGALYGAGSGDSISDRLQKAQTGAIIGGIGGTAIAPVTDFLGAVGNEIKPITSAISDAWRGRNPAGAQAVATDQIARAIASDQASGTASLTPQQFGQAKLAGQPVVVGDLGGKTTAALARKANQAPDVGATMTEPLAERFETQGPRLKDFMTGMVGDLDTAAEKADLRAHAQSINSPAYRQAYADGASGVWNPGSTVIDNSGKQVPNLQDLIKAGPVKQAIGEASGRAANDAVLTGRPIVKNPFVQDANGDWQLGTVYNPKNVATGTAMQGVGVGGNKAVPSLEFWDKVKQGLDAQVGAAYKSGDKYLGNQIRDMSDALKTNLDQEVPSYAAARQGAWAQFNAANAFEAGQKFLGLSKAGASDAQKAALDTMDPADKQLFAKGMAADIAQRGMNAKETQNVVNLFNSPEIAEKIRAGMGPLNANQIEAWLKVENGMQNLRAAALAQPPKKSLLGEIGELGEKATGPISGALLGGYGGYHETPEGAGLLTTARNVGSGVVLGALAGTLRKKWSANNENIAKSVADQLVSGDPTAYKRIAASPWLMDGLRKVEGGIGYLAGARQEQPQ